MSIEEDKLLVRIAEMYYLEEKNQNQISKELNIHRSTISRLLQQSRDKGIVTISINYDKTGTYSIEKQLQEKYDLKKAIIVPAASDLSRIQKDRMLGQSVGEYLNEILEKNMIIGFSWGETMSSVSRELKNTSIKDIMCIPMIGGPSGRLISDYHVNTITYEASKNLNARALLIDSPAFPETTELKKALMENEFNQELINYWRKIDIAILGIGSPDLKASETWKQFYGEDVLSSLENQKVVGDVVSRFFNSEGKHINNELDDRLIGIDTNDLKRATYRIGVAESINKADAIHSAVLGGYINVLITTEETATELLKK